MPLKVVCPNPQCRKALSVKDRSTPLSSSDSFENVAAPINDTLNPRGAAMFLYLFAREGVTHISQLWRAGRSDLCGNGENFPPAVKKTPLALPAVSRGIR